MPIVKLIAKSKSLAFKNAFLKRLPALPNVCLRIKLTQLVQILLVANLGLMAACSSGSSSTDNAVDTVNTASENDLAVVDTSIETTDPLPQSENDNDTNELPTTADPTSDPDLITGDQANDNNEPANTGDAMDSESPALEEPVAGDVPDTTTPPENTDADPVERSPIELFLDEIRLAAGDRVVELNRRFASGEEISNEQNACLGSYEPALGVQVTELDCTAADSGLSVYGSELILQQVELSSSDACQQSLSSGSLDSCELQRASIILPVIWVPIENPAPSQIGTIRPLPDAAFSYNTTENGILQINNRSNLFAPLLCEIDIESATLLTTEQTLGNCRSQINELTSRLFEFRQGT